jgi:energy-coupling factor transporter ATP-binding protein EcfA2
MTQARSGRQVTYAYLYLLVLYLVPAALLIGHSWLKNQVFGGQVTALNIIVGLIGIAIVIALLAAYWWLVLILIIGAAYDLFQRSQGEALALFFAGIAAVYWFVRFLRGIPEHVKEEIRETVWRTAGLSWFLCLTAATVGLFTDISRTIIILAAVGCGAWSFLALTRNLLNIPTAKPTTGQSQPEKTREVAKPDSSEADSSVGAWGYYPLAGTPPAVPQQRAKAPKPVHKGLVWQIQTQVSQLDQSAKDAETWYERCVEQVRAEEKHQLEEIDARRDQAFAQAQSAYDAVATVVTAELDTITERGGLQAASWLDPPWRAWKLPADSTASWRTRLGRLFEKGQWDQLAFPALLPIIGGRGVLFEAQGAAKDSVVRASQSLLLRLLATIPPGKLHFAFIDPISLGQNVAPLMHLADYDEALVTGKAWTEPDHIEQRFGDLTEHMENVIQKYLRNQYATIEDYNAQAGEVAEPYRVLVVFDFPANFTETAARRLISVAQSGPRCGVYAVILVDTEKPLPYGFSLADLERSCTLVTWSDGHFVWHDPDFNDCVLRLDDAPDVELFNHIVSTVGAAAVETSKVEVPFERVAPPSERFWTGDSGSGLRVPLGPAGARKLQYLDLGKSTAQHALVVGKTGSGKSTLLHTLITDLALTYSPDEVELYLVDFKKGVEFKTYATHVLPHARVVAIESEREFGLSVLQGLDAELKRRGDLFRAAGVDHIADYRAKMGRGAEEQRGRGESSSAPPLPFSHSPTLPRILLIVDEFQEFFTEDDPIASQASQILDRLVRQGRAFGIHVLLGSQTLAGAYTLARSTIDQMAVRIAFQCSEADSRLILADDNPAARLLSRPGEAIYNAANGLVEGNNRFQVAWLPDDQRDRYLAQVQQLAQARGYRPAQPQIVFEGNAPAEVEKNRPLRDLLTSPLSRAAGEGPGVRAARAYLGDPIAIREPVAAVFRRQSGSNLLIVGQNDEAALGMTSVALLSLTAQHAADAAQFFALDFGAADAVYADLLPNLLRGLPHTVRYGRRRELPGIIAGLAAEVNRRLDGETLSPSQGEGWGGGLYLLLYGLQRARDLRQDEGLGFSSFSEEPAAPNPAQQFATILREGPDVGVHTIVWCDTLTNLNRSLDRRSLREFAMRVVFQMSAEDSANLVDSPVASKLGPHRALFYDEDEGRLEKFRPYGVPSAQWLAWAGEQVRQNSPAPA